MNVQTEGDLSEYIAKYNNWGLSLIPIRQRDKKPAISSWTPYQTRRATEEELSQWFGNNSANVAIVCGPVSGNLVVLDFDNLDLYVAFCNYWGNYYGKKPEEMTPVVKSGGGGYHVWIKSKQLPPLYHPLGEQRQSLPDIQSEGGYVLAPPSIHPTGNIYRFLNDSKSIHEVDSLKELAIEIPARSIPQNGGEETIPEGGRNATLTSLAGTMRRRGMSQSAIEAALLEVNATQCQPLLSEDEVKAIAASVARYDPSTVNNTTGNNSTCVYIPSGQTEIEAKRDKKGTQSGTSSLQKEASDLSLFEGLAKRVRAWVQDTSGWWETRELDSDLNIAGSRDKENRKKILKRLRVQGLIEKHPKINKQFRYVNTRVTSLDFKTVTNAGILPLKWPLKIEQYVNLFPGNIAVVAGSPNAGKTALLLSFIRQNQDSLPIYYFCSEMGPVELRDRLEKFPGMDIEDWRFEAIERAGDFADVIRPDCINIIDYLEMTTELYAVNNHLTAISHKLGSGIALVALQKKLGAAYGRGQEFGLEKPKLYLSMDKGKLQIIKGKSWAKKNVDPNGLKVSFKIIDGCQFQLTGEWD